jgi:hypothetical protein
LVIRQWSAPLGKPGGWNYVQIRAELHGYLGRCHMAFHRLEQVVAGPRPEHGSRRANIAVLIHKAYAVSVLGQMNSQCSTNGCRTAAIGHADNRNDRGSRGPEKAPQTCGLVRLVVSHDGSPL